MTRRILLCATDFSEASRLALSTAIDLARAMARRLLVVHVASDQGPCVGVGCAVVHLPSRAGRERIQQRLTRFVPPLTDLPVESRVVEGDAATEILRLAREGDCAAIVIGARAGKKGPGPVAERILREAHCPVIIAPGTPSRVSDALTTPR